MQRFPHVVDRSQGPLSRARRDGNGQGVQHIRSRLRGCGQHGPLEDAALDGDAIGLGADAAMSVLDERARDRVLAAREEAVYFQSPVWESKGGLRQVLATWQDSDDVNAPAVPVGGRGSSSPQLQSVVHLEEVAYDIPDLFRLRAVTPPHTCELLRFAASRLPPRMSGPALGQEQLLQTGDPALTDQLENILKTVEKQARRAAKPQKSILKKTDGPKPANNYPQQYLVYALDCKTGREHLLNGFDTQQQAEESCRWWQAQHRKWYSGFNNFTMSVRGLFLNLNGPGGLTHDTLFTLSADWE